MKALVSKLSRRGFFAAAAASPLAIEGVAKDIEARAFTYSAGYGSQPPGAGGTSDGTGEGRYLRQLYGELADLKLEPVAPHEVSRLDPDLIANRSMALHARLRIQAERDAVRRLENNKSWRLRSIADLIKRGVS